MVIKYNEEQDEIIASYDDNFGKVSEVDVTKQALDAAFKCLLSGGLATIAEYCEYEVNGIKFRVSVIKDEEPAIEIVKHGKWLLVDGYYATYECSVCHVWGEGDERYCPNCGKRMECEEQCD